MVTRSRQAVLMCVIVAAAGPARAQFDLTWWTIAGGGTTFTTGGAFSLSGTDGQPDANAPLLAGGPFELTGGFWSSVTSDPVLVGDLNCDGTVNFADINPFVQYLSNFSAWQGAHASCPPEVGDINGDGTYGQWSFGDINPFVALLTGSGGPCLR